MIKIVDNTSAYWEFIRTLRNDIRVQSGFIEKIHISKEAQYTYMSKNAEYYIIALYNGKPVGYAGSINSDIRVCVHPDFQKLGIGLKLIDEITDRFPDSYARVKIENEASKALFKKCGFNEKFWIMKRD